MDNSTTGTSPALKEPVRVRRQACDRCWKRKNKCDRLLPSCSTCLAAKIECQAREWRFKAASEDLGLTNASIASYVKTLEQQVEQLQNTAPTRPEKRQCVQLGRAGSVGGIITLEQVRDGNSTYSPASEPFDPRSVESSIRDTMGEIGNLSRSAMAEPRAGPGHLPHNLTLGNILHAALALNGPDPARATLADEHNISLGPTLSAPFRLHRDITSTYLNRFVDHVCRFYPFLDEKVLVAQYEDLVRSPDDIVPEDLPSERALPYFNVCLAIAIGALTTSNSLSSSALIVQLYRIAVGQLPTICERHTMKIAHCLLLLAIFSMINPIGGSAWHLIGLAMNTCVSLGLNKEPDEHLQLTDSEKEERRNLFWSAYILDRSISVALDRPFSIQDEDITVLVPMAHQSANEHEAALQSHVVTQARMISMLTINSGGAIMHDYGNYCCWRELPLDLKTLASSKRAVMDYIDQLSCRTAVYLIMISPFRQQTGGILSNAHDMEADIKRTCRHFINRCYQRFQDHSYAGTFIDGYDMLSATVTFVFLTQRSSGRRHDNNGLGTNLDMIHKCSILMAVFGERFSIFKEFHRCLLAISGRLLSGDVSQAPLETFKDQVKSMGHVRTMINYIMR